MRSALVVASLVAVGCGGGSSSPGGDSASPPPTASGPQGETPSKGSRFREDRVPGELQDAHAAACGRFVPVTTSIGDDDWDEAEIGGVSHRRLGGDVIK